LSTQTKIGSFDTLEVALLTVCLDQESIMQTALACKETRWALSRADFDSYLTAAERTVFSPAIKAAVACVALVDFDQDQDRALETVRYLDQCFYGRIAIVALTSSEDSSLPLQAMRAGCNEFLAKPFQLKQFEAALKRLDARWTATLGRIPRGGNVLSFFATKGGVGATTLAVHLGMFLVQCHKKKTLVIDNHRHLGHVCLYLGIDGNRYHFNELVRNVDRLDSDLLRGYVAVHPSGLEVLACPDTLGADRNIDNEAIERTLDFLRTEYDYVLLDGDSNMESASMAAIGRSDHVYLIATPEIGAIRDLSRYVDSLVLLDNRPDKMHVVINRYSSRDAVSTEHIEKAIRLPISIRIPNNYNELVHSINAGVPISPEKKSDFSLHIRKWADAIVGSSGAEMPAPAKKRFALWG
jgi:pilus assembly protein CpaE